MPFNIQEFRSRIDEGLGLLRSNKYLLRLSRLPIALATAKDDQGNPLFPTSLNEGLEFYVSSVNVPGAMLMTGEHRRYGYGAVTKKPYAPIFTDCQLLLNLDQKGHVAEFMYGWLRSALNYTRDNGRVRSDGWFLNPAADNLGSATTRSSRSLSYYEVSYRHQYVVDADIIVYDDAGTVSMTITLNDAFPTTIADSPLAWSQTNGLYQLPVTLAYTDLVMTRGGI